MNLNWKSGKCDTIAKILDTSICQYMRCYDNSWNWKEKRKIQCKYRKSLVKFNRCWIDSQYRSWSICELLHYQVLSCENTDSPFLLHEWHLCVDSSIEPIEALRLRLGKTHKSKKDEEFGNLLYVIDFQWQHRTDICNLFKRHSIFFFFLRKKSVYCSG